MSKRIYVGNLPFKTTDDDLKKLFENYGDVIEAEVICYKKSGRSKGYGFVIQDDAFADKAIEELHKSNYEGRILKVNEAKDRKNFPKFTP